MSPLFLFQFHPFTMSSSDSDSDEYLSLCKKSFSSKHAQRVRSEDLATPKKLDDVASAEELNPAMERASLQSRSSSLQSSPEVVLSHQPLYGYVETHFDPAYRPRNLAWDTLAEGDEDEEEELQQKCRTSSAVDHVLHFGVAWSRMRSMDNYHAAIVSEFCRSLQTSGMAISVCFPPLMDIGL
jgi:hypothetical protein